MPGVREHAHFLKNIRDAQAIRNTILSRFEEATSPMLTDEERRDILRVIVVGGGPAPGINGVISSVTIEAINQGLEVIGVVEIAGLTGETAKAGAGTPLNEGGFVAGGRTSGRFEDVTSHILVQTALDSQYHSHECPKYATSRTHR